MVIRERMRLRKYPIIPSKIENKKINNSNGTFIGDTPSWYDGNINYTIGEI